MTIEACVCRSALKPERRFLLSHYKKSPRNVKCVCVWFAVARGIRDGKEIVKLPTLSDTQTRRSIPFLWMNEWYMKVKNQTTVTSSISILIINFSFPCLFSLKSIFIFDILFIEKVEEGISNGGCALVFWFTTSKHAFVTHRYCVDNYHRLKIIGLLFIPNNEGFIISHSHPKNKISFEISEQTSFIIYFYWELKLYFLPDLLTSLKCRTFTKTTLFSPRSLEWKKKVLFASNEGLCINYGTLENLWNWTFCYVFIAVG